MKILLSHPTGNRNVRAILTALDRKDMLAKFCTTLAVSPESAYLKFVPKGFREQLLRRSYEVNGSKIWGKPMLELARMILPKVGFSKAVAHENSFASTYSVYKDFDSNTAAHLTLLHKKERINAVYAYEDGALETFTRAKQLGIKCIYDLPIAYWETGRRLMLEEANRYPEWSMTLGGGITDSEKKLERKTKELELADMVVGPGQFVMDSLPQWSRDKKILMVPFGSPVSNGSANTQIESRSDSDKPLRILFVGSMGQRKGLADLFAAVNIIGDTNVELVVMGSLSAPMEFYKQQLGNFTYEPGRPNEQVLQLMRSCDVFCLPSIVEGRALVMQEAMSQGLPVIITPNTGGADLVREGETGFLVPIRSPELIAEKIQLQI